MAKEIITSLEVLFTANTQPVDKAAKGVQDRAQKIEKKPVTQKVDGDAKGALDSMDRVEAEAKKIVSAKTLATVDANIDKAEKNLTSVRERLDYLRSIEATMEVTADIKRAETALKQIERRRDGLVSARESMVVDADTAPAEAALKDLSAKAGDAGEAAGADAGDGLAGGIIAALVTIPFAGAVVGIGAAIGKSLLDGLQVEVRSDRLMATTGLDPTTVGKLARAAGEAYASNWGESLEANMDTARLAIQNGLLDPTATARDSQKIITSLAGIADIMGGDISRTSQAAATLIRSGLARDTAGAFDVIVRGFQVGNDKAEDWLDTLIEYPSVLTKLGLTGAEATGLINQGLTAGARNSDVVADALKEFQIRATDASTASADGYKRIGLSAEEMTAKIAAGGEGAREGLAQVLDGLRAMEDPVDRNAAAVELFGTKAEDLGDALFALDLSSAVDELGAFAGAAQSALDTLGDNAAADIASAQRNIEVAADGIKGALAAAFNPQIEDFATFVAENRAQVMEFLLDLANGGLDAARAVVDGTASMTEGFGHFVGTAGPQMLDFIGSILEGFDKVLKVGAIINPVMGAAYLAMGSPLDDWNEFAATADATFRGIDEGSSQAADAIRTNLITNGIDPAQAKLNEFALPLVAQARVHDATVAVARDIDSLGTAADQSTVSFEGLDTANLTATESGQLLDGQLRAIADGLREQVRMSAEAGEASEDTSAAYLEARDSLLQQIEAMGLTREQAEDLIRTYGLVPGDISTAVAVETETARRDLDNFIVNARKQKITLSVGASGQINYRVSGTSLVFNALGNILEPMAAGTLDRAAVVSPNTWRIVGDREDVNESYIPWDGSARSLAILAATIRGMPGVDRMTAGTVVGTGDKQAPVVVAHFTDAQVERLAQAFETGSVRASNGVMADQARALRVSGRMRAGLSG